MFTRRSLLLTVAASLPIAVAQKKPAKPPEIEVLECSVKRQGDLIVLDGRIKNVTDRRLKDLSVLFDFLSPEKQVITTKRGGLDEEVLAPGDDGEFHSQVEPPPRATYFQVSFEDG